MNKKHFTAIVLSAGKGNRMHSDIPKQYMDMQGPETIHGYAGISSHLLCTESF